MKDYSIHFGDSADHTNSGFQHSVLPIGNGYMGMCVYGGSDVEYLQFNEKTLWAGGPSDKRPDYNGGNIKGSDKILKDIQTALEVGDDSRVNRLKDSLIGLEDGYGNYLNFGEVVMDFGHKKVKNYKRALDINNAIASVEYTCDGVRFEREYFANYPHNVMAMRIKSSGEFAFEIGFDIAQSGCVITACGDSITACGKVVDNGLNYYAKLVVLGAKATVSHDNLQVVASGECVILMTAGTDYKDIFPTYRGELPSASVDKRLEVASAIGYDKLRAEHVADYKSFYDRATFDIGASVPTIPTNKLIKNYKKNHNSNDARYLEEILFAYGRYLIISSSRDGSLPANLQGVWNNTNSPAWGCDYHLNVNLQMCYWHVFTTNLPEMARPMIKYMESLRVAGRVTARDYHNIVSTPENPENGWVCHTQCTPFGWTCPGWAFDWGWSPAASSWMMQNCWDYYEFTQDKEVLKSEVYPMMRENAKFWLQNLIYVKDQDRWVSSPSYSPEHGPISVGNTYEQEMIFILFRDTIKAGEIVGDDQEFLNKLREIMPKLNPLGVGAWGQLKEWYEEDDWFKDGISRKVVYKLHGCQFRHRHSSNLIGLYPSIHITQETPALFEAAKVSLLERGVGRELRRCSGWGKANKINMWARLKDGERAYSCLVALLTGSIANNLWDLHPPFQMDGNCGYTSGVTEMICYSNGDYIELLPALPKAWANGSVSGICARGGYTVDMTWKNGGVTEFTVHSTSRDKVMVRVFGVDKEVMTNKPCLL